MKQITSRQCRTARSLLKWNIHDLAARTRVPFRTIDLFEKNLKRIQRHESEELINVFTQSGVIFQSDFEVYLKDEKSKDEDFRERLDNSHKQQTARDQIVTEEIAPDVLASGKAKTYEVNDSGKPWVRTPEYTGPDRRDEHAASKYTGTERRSDRQGNLQRILHKYKK